MESLFKQEVITLQALKDMIIRNDPPPSEQFRYMAEMRAMSHFFKFLDSLDSKKTILISQNY